MNRNNSIEMLAPLLSCTGAHGAQYQLAVAASTQHSGWFPTTAKASDNHIVHGGCKPSLGAVLGLVMNYVWLRIFTLATTANTDLLISSF